MSSKIFNPKTGRKINDNKLNQKKVSKYRDDNIKKVKSINERLRLQEQLREIQQKLKVLDANKKVKKSLKKYINNKRNTTYVYDVWSVAKPSDEVVEEIRANNAKKVSKGLKKTKNLVNIQGNTFFISALIGRIKFTKKMKSLYLNYQYPELTKRVVGGQDEKVKEIINIASSETYDFFLENEQKYKEITNMINFDDLNANINFDSSSKTITNKYIKNIINMEAVKPNYLFKDIINKQGHQCCGLDILMTLKTQWNSRHKNKMTIEWLKQELRIRAGKKTFIINEENGAFGVPNELLGDFCLNILKTKFCVFDTFGVVIYPKKTPIKNAFKNLNSNHLNSLYVIQTDNHYYLVSREYVNSICQSTDKDYKAITTPSEFFFIKDNTKIEEDEPEEKYMIDSNEILTHIKESVVNERSRNVYCLDRIMDIIVILKNDFEIKCEVVGNLATPTGCYILHNIEGREKPIKVSFTSMAGNQKNANNIENTNMDLTNEQFGCFIRDRKHLLNTISTRNMVSDYSDDSLDFFKNTPTALITSFENTNSESLHGVDCVKSYSYLASQIDFPQFSILDTYEDYEGQEIKDDTALVCEWKSDIFTTKQKLLCQINDKVNKRFQTWGFLLKMYNALDGKGFVNEEYKIIKFIQPRKTNENTLKEYIPNMYEKKEYPDSLIKFNVNSVLGIIGSLKNTKKRTFLSNNQMELKHKVDELQELSKELPNYKSSGIIPYENFFYFCETNSTEMSSGLFPIMSMIYCFQRMRNLITYCHLEKQGIKVIAVHTDSMMFDMNSLNQIQKDYINRKCSGKFGGYKLDKGKRPPKVGGFVPNEKVQPKIYYENVEHSSDKCSCDIEIKNLCKCENPNIEMYFGNKYCGGCKNWLCRCS